MVRQIHREKSNVNLSVAGSGLLFFKTKALMAEKYQCFNECNEKEKQNIA